MALPPLNGLLALEAVIRLNSVSRAAAELGVSQPAISQRLRALERHFGRKLINRTSTGFSTAPDVEVFAARLATSLEDIRQASAAFRSDSRSHENRLTIAVLSTFAQRWLIPRLVGFQRAYPDVDVHLMTTSLPADLERPDADISIRCGVGRWRGCVSHFLVRNQIFPVANPDYVERYRLRKPKDLGRATCIRVDASPRDADWSRWLEAAGVTNASPRSWQSYVTSTHAVEAATAGLGVAMAHSPFVSDSLASGRLVKPFDTDVDDTDGDYFLVYRATKDVPRHVRLFRDWLTDQARN